MRSLSAFRIVIASAVAALCMAAPAASAQTFSNAVPITFPVTASDGRAAPYPSRIVVSGVPNTITQFAVSLSGLSHTWTEDVNVLLVAPGGQRILLMANTNGGANAENITLTFTHDGTATLPPGLSNIVSGTYAPSVYFAPAALPAPAPAGPYGATIAPLIGTNPNGTWDLYVWDDTPSVDDGIIAGGWSISINQLPALAVTTAFTYQGVLASGGVPISGDANVRFTLCNNATADVALSDIAPPITRNFSGVADGLIGTSLDFGTVVDAWQALWLNIEVESPPGSGFVTLSPRQPITPTPQARSAQFARRAGTVPWTGISGVPANVSNAFSPWSAIANGINFNAGNVAIGTVTPASRFHVAGTETIMSTIEGSSALGTWFNLQNTTTNGRIWRLISTGSANGEGAGNLVIGHGTGIGSNVTVMFMNSQTNNVGIGTILPTQRLTVAGNVQANNVTVPSSGRFKHNVAPITDPLGKLLRLDGVTFDWNPDFAKDRPGREHDIGFVAEDVAKVFPEVVFYDADGNVTGMDYSRLTAVAVAAIKQQQAEFDEELAKRDAENADLRARLEAIEATLTQTQSDAK